MSLALSYKDGDPANFDKCTPREQSYAVKQKPSFLTYLSYMFFVGNVCSGPFVEFKTFDDFINYRGNYATIGYFDTWYSALKRLI
jgi:hypothetical protein